MTCHRCRRPVVEIVIQGVNRFTLRACSTCDHRAWAIDDQPASLDDVLGAVRSERRIRAAA